MAQGWSFKGAPQHGLPAGSEVTLVDGTTFCISDCTGDIGAGREQGLFYDDTRYLSRLGLTVDGEELEPLGVHVHDSYWGEFILRRRPRYGLADSTLLVVRSRYVGNGMLEEVALSNYSAQHIEVELALHVLTDFASLFEVKEDRVHPHRGITMLSESRRDQVGFRLDLGSETRAVAVRPSDHPQVEGEHIRWRRRLGPRQTSSVSIEIVPSADGIEPRPRYRKDQPAAVSPPATEIAQWRAEATRISTPSPALDAVFACTIEDLGALRVGGIEPEGPVIAAGAPWFMTLFGRDSLLTSWMLLPVDPGLGLGTLRTLALLQGAAVNERSEEQPGRILHEVRSGIDTALELGRRGAYYGSVDATPLFVMLFGELWRWGADSAVLAELLPHVDRALEWIECYGDSDGDGFVEYQRLSERGLINQGWKDSFDAVAFSDGRSAGAPIALSEVQGYAYAAFCTRAEVADALGDDAMARRYRTMAADLKRRFNAAFWLEDRGYLAMALDRDKRPVDALASNMGHCLWTGIVDEDKAEAVAARLVCTELASGYGVRTLATSMHAYNPMSYHNGSVWPHDTAIAVAGLMRYGYVKEAHQLALGLLDAAEQLGGHLPELFCGLPREEFGFPVPYPTSCQPQAWAAAAPLLVWRALLRLDPDVPSGEVFCAPALPQAMVPLRSRQVHLAGRMIDIEVDEGSWSLGGLPPGLALRRRPCPMPGVVEPTS